MHLIESGYFHEKKKNGSSEKHPCNRVPQPHLSRSTVVILQDANLGRPLLEGQQVVSGSAATPVQYSAQYSTRSHT